MLGDGSLALYGRSINAHYREHGCDAQKEYRKWKADQLKRLDFKFSDGGKYGKLYFLSRERFTREENVILRDHINNTFNFDLILKKRPDGNNYVLAIYKQNDIVKFFRSSKTLLGDG